MKPSGVFQLLLLLVMVFSCEKSTAPAAAQPVINFNTVADLFGNNDGIVSQAEKDSLEHFFQQHSQLWAVGPIAQECVDTTAHTVAAEAAVEAFTRGNPLGPYASENNLRTALKDVSLRTPFVSIVVLERNSSDCVLTKYYRAPGANFSNQVWEELQIR